MSTVLLSVTASVNSGLLDSAPAAFMLSALSFR